MTKVFQTASGSLYELDKAAKRIRRLCGMHAATARQGIDSEWKTYEQLQVVNGCAVIVWRVVDGKAECTQTSRLVKWVSN